MNFPTLLRRKAAPSIPPTRSYGEFGMGPDGAAELALYRAALRRLAAAIIERREHETGRKLYSFIKYNRRDLDLNFAGETRAEQLFERDPDAPLALLRELLNCWPPEPVRPASAFQRRVDFLARAYGFASHEAAVLGLLGRREVMSRWERLLARMLRCEEFDHARLYAAILDLSYDAVDAAFAERGALVKQGIATHFCGSNGCYLSSFDFISRFLSSGAESEREMVAALVPVLPPSTLDPVDFAHMAAALNRAIALTAEALASGQRANLLLYGVPGTGKSEFARLIAQSCCASAIAVGAAGEDGDEPTRSERLGHLRLCRKLTGSCGAGVPVIDEAEDLFLSGVEARGSKLWLNRLVEEGTGPHIWIVNDPDLLGEPVVRRMDMAIRFDTPSQPARRAIVSRLVAREGGAFGEGESKALVDDLATLETSPAILSAAMRTAARVGVDAKGTSGLARDLAEASGRMPGSRYVLAGTKFDPALSVADCDLVDLAGKLSAAKGAWSLLLSGPPGTGKTAFARHLAERSGCDLICRSGADLLGMYVGETEKQIASAFAEAERAGAILLIDEADSFLASRDTAQRNWEVSMTNEMLRQMERGTVRLIATTNRAASLDAASARRFTLHAEFAALDAERARQLFEVTFGIAAPPSLDRFCDLTPGDFAQASARAQLLGEKGVERIASWLAETVAARDGKRHPLGF